MAEELVHGLRECYDANNNTYAVKKCLMAVELVWWLSSLFDGCWACAMAGDVAPWYHTIIMLLCMVLYGVYSKLANLLSGSLKDIAHKQKYGVIMSVFLCIGFKHKVVCLVIVRNSWQILHNQLLRRSPCILAAFASRIQSQFWHMIFWVFSIKSTLSP